MLKKMVYALVLGAIITGITGLMNTTPQKLVGALWYGFPLAYRYVPVVPSPVTTWDFGALAIDFGVWALAVFAVLWLLGRIWK